MLSNNTKENYEGYDDKQILDGLRENYRGKDKPYAFEFGSETDLSNGMASVIIKQSSNEMEFELHKQPDGTWKI